MMTDQPTEVTTITLPFPPSVNHIWRTALRGRRAVTYMSAAGKKYRSEVIRIVRQRGLYRALIGRLTMEVVLYPPDNRRRDMDNTMKAIGDSLQHAGVYKDDSQIDWLLIRRGEVKEGGRVLVTIKEYSPGLTVRANPRVKQPDSAKRRAGESVSS